MSTGLEEQLDRLRAKVESAPAPEVEQPGADIEAAIEERKAQVLCEAAVRRWLERAGVGVRLFELEIDPALVPRECSLWLAAYRRGAGMVVSGPPGTGKSASAVHCLREVYRDGAHHVPGRRWRFNPAPCFWTKARNLYRAVFQRDEMLLKRARESFVLVIDEWGGAYESAWPLAEIDGIIDDRWENRLATIITTNTHPSAGEGCLAETAPRALDRLCDEPGPGVVILDRKSLRGEAQRNG